MTNTPPTLDQRAKWLRKLFSLLESDEIVPNRQDKYALSRLFTELLEANSSVLRVRMNVLDPLHTLGLNHPIATSVERMIQYVLFQHVANLQPALAERAKTLAEQLDSPWKGMDYCKLPDLDAYYTFHNQESSFKLEDDSRCIHPTFDQIFERLSLELCLRGHVALFGGAICNLPPSMIVRPTACVTPKSKHYTNNFVTVKKSKAKPVDPDNMTWLQTAQQDVTESIGFAIDSVNTDKLSEQDVLHASTISSTFKRPYRVGKGGKSHFQKIFSMPMNFN